MNKSDLIRKVAERTGKSGNATKIIINGFIDVVSETLASGDSVNLPGFGKFYVKERGEREGVNPQTGEKIKIKPHKAPLFRAGETLKQKVNGG